MVHRLASIFQTPKQREWLIQMLRCPHFKWQEHYDQDLSSRTRDRSWWERDRTQYAFDIFLRAGCIESPAAFPTLWRSRVRAQLTTLANCTAAGIPPNYKQFVRILLEPYFCQRAPYTYFHWLFNNASPFHFPRATDISGQVWKDTLDVLVSVADTKTLCLFSIDNHIKNIDKGHEGPQHAASLWRTTDLREYYTKLLKAAAAAARAKQKAFLDPLKEELMAVTWHPRRIAAALEAGINPEDL
jgi:hypothetical protein